MLQFQTILSEISDQYSHLKPYPIPDQSTYGDTKYDCVDKKLRAQLLGISKHMIDSENFRLLPELASRSQLMFVELNCEQNQPLNEFITANYSEISEYCTQYLCYDFCSTNSTISRIDAERIKYFRPFLSAPTSLNVTQMVADIMERCWYDPIKHALGVADEPIRGILSFRDDHVLYYRIDGESDSQMIRNFVRFLFLTVPISTHSYNAVVDYNPCFDERFADNDSECTFYKLLEEAQEKIERMESMGIEREIILNLLDDRSAHRLSQLVVTSDFRILLPDFGNIEITMPPLAKTLYIFYLNHPEGLLFRDLRHYRQDLLNIYMEISKRENYDEMVSSIDMLVDSTENSVNENRSRIRSAFLKEFCESIASKYYISGYGRDTPKRILLDRSKVTLQCNIKDRQIKIKMASLLNLLINL